MERVFISYSRQDGGPVAEMFYTRLTGAGYEAFKDDHSLPLCTRDRGFEGRRDSKARASEGTEQNRQAPSAKPKAKPGRKQSRATKHKTVKKH